MKLDEEITEAPTEVVRDMFRPPVELEEKCVEAISALEGFMPQKPTEAPPSLVGAPEVLDKAQATTMFLAAARWMEFYGPQIGKRKAARQVLEAAVRWMTRYVAFTHKGKTDKLTPEQFALLQDYSYKLDLIEAEVLLLDSLATVQAKLYTAASRNLTGIIAPGN